MFWKYSAACLIIFALLAFLKFVEDSPIRSWKTVFFTTISLSFIVCYYISCAFPPPPPPQPRNAKVASNRAELERTFRRIAGVDRASINGSEIEINFAEDKPIAELKSIAQQTGGTAAYFLQLNGTNHITMHISVRGQKRYRMEYETGRGVVDEQEF